MSWLADFSGDARFAVRTLRRNPAFAATALLTLALGIGANTAVFSLVHAVLLKPLPYPDPDRIVALTIALRGRGSSPGTSAPKFNEWRRQTDTFEDAAAYTFGGVMNVTSLDRPEQIDVARVSAGFFRLFGARVVRGRTFTADEDRPSTARVAVLSDGFWRRAWGADPEAVGRTVTLDGEPYTVVGILEPGFDADSLSVSIAARPDIWLPMQLDPYSQSDLPFLAAARLREGVSIEAAQARTDLVTAAVRDAFPAVMPAEASLSLQPLRTLVVGDVRPSLLILLAAVALVLLIVCANTANLLLVRASIRQREMAIRLSTGAGRGRIVRQLITESLVLSTAGGGLGLLLATIGLQAIVALPSGRIPRIVQDGPAATLDWPVLAFTALVAIATGVVFGLVPARRASRVDLTTALKAGSHGAGSGAQAAMTRALVIAEMALAVLLVIGAALLIRSFLAIRGVDPGFDTRGVWTLQMAMTGPRFASTAGMAPLVAEGLRRLDATAEVESAAATMTGVPLGEGGSFLNITIPGRSLGGAYFGGGHLGGWHLITPGYFDAFRIPLVGGRLFTDRDDRSAPPIVIINQAMARLFWPDDDPLDHQIVIGAGAGPDFEETTPRRIVGVVGDIHHVGLEFAPRPTAYVPLAQMGDHHAALFNRIGGRLTWIVRTRGASPHLIDAMQRELRHASGGLAVARIRSMDDVSAASTARRRFDMSLMVIFGGASLLLAAIGVSGMMAYTVQQRTREIGIRVALGAEARAVRRMVLGQGLRLTAMGVAIGTGSALGLTRLMAGLLFGVSAHDAVVFVTAPLVLGAASWIAIWLPARRAATIEPTIALRQD